MLHEARRDARREARAAMFSDGGGGGGAGGSAGGGGGGGGGGRGGFASSHRSPFSYASLRRSHPQAFASAEREARSSSANAAAVAAATGAANTTMSAAGLFPPYSPPSPTMPQHANVRLVPSSMNVLGGNEGGGGGSGDSYQVPDISQNLVDFIAQMSQSEDRNRKRLLCCSCPAFRYFQQFDLCWVFSVLFLPGYFALSWYAAEIPAPSFLFW